MFTADFSLSSSDVKQALIQWQERIDFAHKLLTLLNSYSPPELRNACLGKFTSSLKRSQEPFFLTVERFL